MLYILSKILPTIIDRKSVKTSTRKTITTEKSTYLKQDTKVLAKEIKTSFWEN